MSEFTKNYLSRRETELIDCNNALKEKNFEVIQRIGHKLKGNALMYGYPELGDLGALMETSAMNKNFDECSIHIIKYKEILETISKSPS